MDEQAKRMYQAAQTLKNIGSQAELARCLGVSAQTLHNWEIRGISRRGLLLLQERIGCNVEWVASASGQMSNNPPPVNGNGTEYRDVPRLYVGNHQAQANPVEQPLVDFLRLSSQFLERHYGQQLSTLRFLHAPDNNMKPTANANDVYLCDVSQTTVKANGVYVFLDAHDVPNVCRMTRTFTGDYQISYDAPTSKLVENLRDHDITVVARVVGVLRLEFFPHG